MHRIYSRHFFKDASVCRIAHRMSSLTLTTTSNRNPLCPMLLAWRRVRAARSLVRRHRLPWEWLDAAAGGAGRVASRRGRSD